jgi:hypothetical protein
LGFRHTIVPKSKEDGGEEEEERDEDSDTEPEDMDTEESSLMHRCIRLLNRDETKTPFYHFRKKRK